MLARRAFAPRIENSHRSDEWKRVPGYLQWLRGRPCFLSVHAPRKHTCSGKVRACHFDPFGDKGMGTKVSDSAAFPMCDGAHAEQHSKGWQTFQREYEFDGRDIVTTYWLGWSDGTPMGAAWKLKQEAGRDQ